MRDTFKRAKNWTQYKVLNTRTHTQSEKKHFSESIASRKDTRTIWKHFRLVTNKGTCNASQSTLSDELNVDNEIYTDSEKDCC